jgi:hypothetical protein
MSLRTIIIKFFEERPDLVRFIPSDRVKVCSLCGLWPRIPGTACPECKSTHIITMARDQLVPVVCCAKLIPYNYNPTV